jgi:hypothetical protein
MEVLEWTKKLKIRSIFQPLNRYTKENNMEATKNVQEKILKKGQIYAVRYSMK